MKGGQSGTFESENTNAVCLASEGTDRPLEPLVSILIVTWNRKTELRRCIDSVLVQTYVSKEIVIVDNGSSDGTATMVSTEYPEAKLIRVHRNMGCPTGRNIGFANCMGKYVYQLDDDGWLKEDAIELAVQRAEHDNTIGVVMSSIHEIEDDRVIRIIPGHKDEACYLATFGGGCSMIRREILDTVGHYPDDFFGYGEESDLAIRLLDKGYYCVLEPNSAMYHRPSPIGRDERMRIYYNLRNTNKTGLRLWPFPWCVLRPIVNMKHAFRFMFVLAYPALPFQVFYCLVRDIFRLRGKRKPVKRSTYRLFRQLSTTYPVLDQCGKKDN